MDNEGAAKRFLTHHGIRGMKWGVKGGASKSSEVSVKTSTGITGKAKIKTSGGKGQPAHPDAIAARVIQQKLAKSGSHALANHEIQALVNRHNLEQQAANVPARPGAPAAAAKHVSNFLRSPHGKASLSVAKSKTNNEKVKKVLGAVAAAAS